MKIRTRLLLLLAILVAISAAEAWWLTVGQPGLSERLAIQQIAGDGHASQRLRALAYLGDSPVILAAAAQLVAVWFLVGRHALEARRRIRTPCMIEE